MQTPCVVDIFYEGADFQAGVVDVAVTTAIDFLLLECLHEALGLGIVVRIADPAHAGQDAMLLQHIGVLATGILDAAIGVVDEASECGLPRRDGHSERSDRKARLDLVLQGQPTTRLLNASRTMAR